ncbi:ATP-binding protein [Chondromyces apiculatus]|uniref:ORC1/DEAH AAA+ ATPase domain-containing protein n=1 Tax=Chondromyces apiculatus DSM 436 TaxID=1192034 RepID=A0A017T3S2_9BACT|nr:ATP-binding protein [Chondromyces apiculatus]EYF03475.1 Hypothetical protein CAP_5459 [Chondromyces apiculatus DSM 436]
MKRRFNVAGPCRPDWHYMIPAERRLPEAPGLVEQRGYFVVHAPRQTGKTTALRALAERLTRSGRYAGLLFSCEAAEVAGDDYGAAEQLLLADMQRKAESTLPEELRPPPAPASPPGAVLGGALAAWARRCPRPLVLIFDEIDALRGQSLMSVLRQLRAGYDERPAAFPSSVILCGLRDVRDDKAASGGDPVRLGTSSPFNVKLSSLRIGDFTPEELRELYAQHTADEGVGFTDAALARAWEVSAGQPWLVNALGREMTENMPVPEDRTFGVEQVERARDRLILERATHLDSLAHRLAEPRVRRIIEPVLAGTYEGGGHAYEDDPSYVRDLGLVAADAPPRIANPIYREVVVRVLASSAESKLQAPPKGAFRLQDGRLAFRRLLRAFAAFWREHGEVLAAGMPYPEVAPQLVLMAFLHRVINGGGFIEREYGVGRGRMDLLVRFPYTRPDGSSGVQRRAMELKVWRRGQKDPRAQGLAQLDEYLTRLGLLRGMLVIFDARGKLARRTPRFEEATTAGGRAVTILRA